MSNLHWVHTVHHVNDLTKTKKNFTKYGLTSRYGGTHPDGGTQNSLSYFGLTYLEFLANE